MYKCPSCNLKSSKLISINFPEKKHLPSTINLCVCDTCELGFTEPRDQLEYDKYYSCTKNDLFGTLTESSSKDEVKQKYIEQGKILSPYLQKSDTKKNILDIGCGNANLLNELINKYPGNNYFGSDPNINECIINNINWVFPS